MKTIDINCDVGEGIDNEKLLMPYISSCNIACGGHAGDIETMDRVIKIAQQYQVKIGAHPSFPDKENFGRKVMDISLEALEVSLIKQVQLIQERLNMLGGTLHHIKAHGALYNVSVFDENLAKSIVAIVKQTAPNVILYVPYNSVIAEVAKQEGLNIKYEVFADRNYRDDLRLVSRSQDDALITNVEEVINHLSKMIIDQNVKTISNTIIPIKAETCCVHGDNEAAIDIVKHIYQSMLKKGITVG